MFSVYQTKNTPYGPLENVPLNELYNGIENKEIKSVYLSDDLKDIYFLNNDDVSLSHIVRSNPILSEKIVERATSQDVKTIILEPENGIFQQGTQLIGGLFDFTLIAITISIAYNFLSLFIRNRDGKGAGMPNNPFGFLNKEDSMVDKSTITTRLTDWAGSPEVFDECFEIVSYIKNSTIYEAAGASIPKGILLDGPPGTGKTLLAKAIAGETNATFLSMSGSEFVELFVGMGASKVRQLFDTARENVPSIVFIDEIDAVGKKRSGANAVNTNDEREQTLNQILAEMDGFQPNTGVIVIAATNRRDVLDEALLRPGRFDRLVYVPLPDRASRESILRLYLKNKNTTGDIRVEDLAEGTAGFSGAQIKNLLNEAAILAARDGKTVITKENIENALEKVVVGITKKTDMRSLAARTRVAIHELGHAILAAHFKDDFELKKVSLKSTYDGVGGFTLFNEYPEIQDSGLYTKDLLLKRIIVALGGKAAETIAYSNSGVSVGASQDLAEANRLARQMVEQYGMSNALETFSIGVGGQLSDTTRHTIDDAVIQIVHYCYTKANLLLRENKEVADKLLVRLLAENSLDGKLVVNIVHG
jgi:cell division protease FtsH